MWCDYFLDMMLLKFKQKNYGNVSMRGRGIYRRGNVASNLPQQAVNVRGAGAVRGCRADSLSANLF